MPSETLDHIIRYAPPWRVESKTECGRDANDVRSVVTRDAIRAKVQREGQKRAAFSTCMTCAERARSRTWHEDPGDILARDARGWGDPDPRLKRELLALTALWEAHQEEYEAILADMAGTTELADRRRRRQARATYRARSRGPGA